MQVDPLAELMMPEELLKPIINDAVLE